MYKPMFVQDRNIHIVALDFESFFNPKRSSVAG